jgi:cystathionine beta-lyase
VSLLPSGLAAISAALLSVVRAGDHVLVTDSAYGPTRNFCGQILSRLGVTTSYYDPGIGAGIAALLQPNTRAVYLESPGSLSFEMQDVAAIAKAAHAKGALVLMDNTWATPLYFRPLDHGVDLVIQAGTKYIGGHSDIMLGTVSANAATVAELKNTVRLTGLCEGPDDVYLGLRGLRTLGIRLDRHAASGAAEPSRPRAVEAGFHRRVGAVQHGAQAGAKESLPRLRQYAGTVRHRRIVGRL